MKAKLYWLMAVVAVMISNCSQEEIVKQSQQVTETLTAIIEGSSRSTVEDGSIFTWTAGDKISVWNGSRFVVYTNTLGNNFTTTESNPGSFGGCAIYPFSIAPENYTESSAITVELPSEYDYSDGEYKENTNAPMLATTTEEDGSILFKHLGGLMCFVVREVPAKANQFVFTSLNKNITGEFTVYDGKIAATDNQSGSSVTIKFKTLTEEKDKMIFYVPLPTCTYTGYKVEIKGEDGLNLSDNNSSISAINTIAQRSLLLMPEFTCENCGLTKATATTVTPSTDASVQGAIATVTGGTVSIAGQNLSEAKATINFEPATDDAVLNIVDASTSPTPSESTATVEVKVKDNVTVPVLNIEAPTTTVELSTSDNGSATYETVTALTATSTLKVNSNITIKRLILKGGNVEIADDATVESFEYEASEGVICVKFAGNVPEGLVSTDKIVYLPNDGVAVSSLDKLNVALSDNQIKTIVLTKDIVSNSEVTINRAITLDLNNTKFSCTHNRFIRIENSNNTEIIAVTIKNGTISNGVSGGRCVETRSGSIDLTLHDVKLITTGSGNPQNFTVGGSGNNIKVTINNSEIEGARAAYGIITFNPVSLNVENSTIDAYAAIYVKDGSNGSTFSIVNSTLIGDNVETANPTNNFGCVVLEDNGITVNVDAQSVLTAETENPNVHSVFLLKSAANESAQINLDVNGTLKLQGDYAKILTLAHTGGLSGCNLTFPATHKEQLLSEGYEMDGAGKIERLVEARIGETLYETLSSAITAAGGNGIVTLIKDVVIDANTVIPAGVTIDGASYNVSTNVSQGTSGKGMGVFLLAGGTIKYVNFNSPNTQYDIIVTAGESTIEECQFNTASAVLTSEGGTETYGKRAIYTGSSVELTGNLTVTGCAFDDQVYAFNFQSDKNKMAATFEDCTLGGWLSGTGASHTFINCTFKKSGEYANYIPYCPATFNSCTFEEGFAISLKKGSTYRFDGNCKYGEKNIAAPENMEWDFSGGTVGTGDNGTDETVYIGEREHYWTNKVDEGTGGEEATPEWEKSGNNAEIPV